MNKWTILIATVGIRNDSFRKLMDILEPQVDAYNGDINVMVYWDNFESTLGKVRQALLESATGQYINFIDDDDMIPPYYCEKVYNLLDGNVDYIGWRMQLFVQGVRQKPTFHSLRYDRWWDDYGGYYRNVSHLNPIKKELALLGRFDRSIPEDTDWAHQVAPYAKTEHYIEEEMYFYHYDPHQSLWRKDNKCMTAYQRPTLNSVNCQFHPWSSI